MRKEDLGKFSLTTTGFCLLDAGMIIELLLRNNMPVTSIKAFLVVKVGHFYVIHKELEDEDKALHLKDSYPDLTVKEVLSSERVDATKRCMDLVLHPKKRHTLDAILAII